MISSISLKASFERDLPAIDFPVLDQVLVAAFAPLSTDIRDDSGSDRQRLVRRAADWVYALLANAGYPMKDRAIIFSSSQSPEFMVNLPCPGECFESSLLAFQFCCSVLNNFLEGKSAVERDKLQRVQRDLEIEAPKGMNTLRFLDAAQDKGIPWQKVGGNVYQFGWGSKARWLDSSFTDVTPAISTSLARNKLSCARVLRTTGMPVPVHHQVYSVEQARIAAERIGYPVVVKPADLDGGKGVAVELKTADKVALAYEQARELSTNILVEKYYPGNDYRVHVYRGEVYWAVHRVPGGVTGDGRQTVRSLLDELNAHPLRGQPGSNSLLKTIDLDAEARELLEEANLDENSTPEAGRFVRLRRAANVASGGVPVPVLEQIHPDNVQLAIRTARLLRLDLAGLDLLMEDISKSWFETGAIICEVNAQPQLSPQLPGYLLDKILEDKGRIPVALVIGHVEDYSWLEALADHLAPAGTVGIAAGNGVMIAGNRILQQRLTAYQGGMALLRDPQIDGAIICLGDESSVSSGLPVDSFDYLLLMGAPEGSGSTVDWKRWINFARNLSRLCTGTVIINKRCNQWQHFRPALAGQKVIALDPSGFGTAMSVVQRESTQ